MAYKLSELAQIAQAEVLGDGAVLIEGVGAMDRAGPHDIAYCASSRYRDLIHESHAGALILTAEDAQGFGGNAIICPDPRIVFARIASILYPPATLVAYHDSRAVIDSAASVHPQTILGPYVVIEAGAVIDKDVVLGAGVVVGRNSHIGEGTRLEARAVVMHDCVIGRRCVISPGAVIGGEGFGYVREKDGSWLKVPQLGRVIIGDDVDIGVNTTIDRGALGDTVIANGVKLDNLIQIGHNVQIGEHTAMAGCVGVAGSAVIGRRCLVAGGAGIIGHITVGDDVEITAMSFLKGSVNGPGRFSSSLPAAPADVWARNAGRLRHLDELARRLRRIEHMIKQILSGGKG